MSLARCLFHLKWVRGSVDDHLCRKKRKKKEKQGLELLHESGTLLRSPMMQIEERNNQLGALHRHC